jgi:hypothetical protein
MTERLEIRALTQGLKGWNFSKDGNIAWPAQSIYLIR